jgi:adenylyl-sulfate kinase
VSDKSNLFTQQTKVSRAQRENSLGHHALVIWFTGLSGSGKSTLATALEHALHVRGFATYLLDGDNIRQGLNKDIGFDDAGRVENIRRIGEVAALMTDAGLIVITAFISPFRLDRELARRVVGPERFVEVFVDCPLEVCEQRDVKGLYRKAREGKVARFTGIHSPYEPPDKPDLVLRTGEWSVEHSLDLLLENVLPRLNL